VLGILHEYAALLDDKAVITGAGTVAPGLYLFGSV